MCVMNCRFDRLTLILDVTRLNQVSQKLVRPRYFEPQYLTMFALK